MNRLNTSLEILVETARLLSEEGTLQRNKIAITDLLDKQLEEVRRKLKELEEADGNS